MDVKPSVKMEFAPQYAPHYQRFPRTVLKFVTKREFAKLFVLLQKKKPMVKIAK
jgi:hypothetical protein